ncbi:MAG: DUF748 domain-containing protein [Paenacidovorax caeni]
MEVRETALSDFFAHDRARKRAYQPAGFGQGGAQAGQHGCGTAAAGIGACVYDCGRPGSSGAVRAGLADRRRCAFSDYFIKPNYSADLSELTGRLSAFSSEPPAQGAVPAMADLELRGRAEGTASLEITGKLNPLAQPLALDIVGKMRDLELPPLSPYTVKYAGHGIERGKLSMDVAYKIEPS